MLGKIFISVFSVVLLLSSIESKSLPKYIQKCSLKDDELSNCALEAAKKALPSILAGDKEHKIQKLTPLKIPLLQLDAKGLNVTLKNCLITGPETVNFNSIKYDKNADQLTVDMNFEYLRVQGEYETSGKILILPIVGKGQGDLHFKQCHFVFTLDLKPGKDGKLKASNPNLETEFGAAYFHLSNLFNGDKRLGDEMNKFLNDNWKEVVTEFGTLISSPINAVLHSVASGILDNLTPAEAFEDA